MALSSIEAAVVLDELMRAQQYTYNVPTLYIVKSNTQQVHCSKVQTQLDRPSSERGTHIKRSRGLPNTDNFSQSDNFRKRSHDYLKVTELAHAVRVNKDVL